MLSMTFTGLVAYPITPFQQGGRLDLESLERYVGRLARSGVDGVVVLGSSGSFAYLSGQERAEVVRVAVDAARGSGVPVGAGISAMTTREVLEMAYAAENSGADGLVLNPLSYIPLVSQEIADQVETVSAAVSLPVCVYNNPTTTGFTYPVELAAELSWLENVNAFKDTADSAEEFDRRRRRFAELAEPGTAHGVSGERLIHEAAPDAAAWHSGIAAVLPRQYAAFRQAVVDGDDRAVRTWRAALAPLMEILRQERPLSSLYALAEVCGVATTPPRRPLLPIPSPSRQRLAEAVEELLDEAPETLS
ncbi:dihydrodipicolinate synthase family protein [Kocuria dechangensis]|uniref:Dihydrodipicolinate synthase family protein n=1 Tax=Kocuria dechangensis TaxID=1176249 RepID=A0A917LTR8_9MICC|nr:dihydrodipicolinate synthase family protein [Kocuria dechangensis]GGG56891.1 dihydrodipicolinate synthase family protein [Kocuria dechangensis]